MIKKLAAGLVVAVVFVGTFAGLALALRGESSEDAKQDFCASLTELGATVESYAGLDPLTATNDELEAAADDIDDAWDEAVDDADDWANAYDNELAQAYDNLYWQIQFLPGDYTAEENLDAVEDELRAFPEAFKATFDGSGCTTA